MTRPFSDRLATSWIAGLVTGLIAISFIASCSSPESPPSAASGSTAGPKRPAVVGDVPPFATDNPGNKTLPLLGSVPTFAFQDQDKTPFGSEQLAGKVWVANFIFTRCRATCPAQTTRLAEVQRQLQGGPLWPSIRLVSITVDPSHDTPQILRKYALRAGANLKHWKFLTGSFAEIRKLCGQGFKLPVGSQQNTGSDSSLVSHSSKFILVDATGRIRGYYEGTSEASCQKLLGDLKLLQDPVEHEQSHP